MCSIGIALTPRPRRRQDALTPQQFNTRVYDVLLRYETLAQFDQGTQGTLPGPAFECLRDDWGVGHECFASPLNGPGPLTPGYAPSAFPAADRFCMAVLYGRAGRLTAGNGGFRPGQSRWGRSTRYSPGYAAEQIVSCVPDSMPFVRHKYLLCISVYRTCMVFRTCAGHSVSIQLQFGTVPARCRA